MIVRPSQVRWKYKTLKWSFLFGYMYLAVFLRFSYAFLYKETNVIISLIMFLCAK